MQNEKAEPAGDVDGVLMRMVALLRHAMEILHIATMP